MAVSDFLSLEDVLDAQLVEACPGLCLRSAVPPQRHASAAPGATARALIQSTIVMALPACADECLGSCRASV